MSTASPIPRLSKPNSGRRADILADSCLQMRYPPRFAPVALLFLTGLAASGLAQDVATLKGHTNTISCLVFAPDGKVLASGAKDGVIKLWDVASGKVLASLGGQKD